MKPFDLEAAKNGAPVVTRDGTEARIICFDRLYIFPMVVLIKEKDGYECAHAFKECGAFNSSENGHRLDLFMAPVKREGWVHLYDSGDGTVIVGQIVYPTDEKPKKTWNFVATVRIEWEE